MYTWSNHKDDEIWRNALFGTMEECIVDAKKIGNLISGDTIAVGEAIPVRPDVDLDILLEQMEQEAYEECGEASEGWNISSVKGREVEHDKLQNAINELVYEYIDKINETPGFFKVEDIKTIEIV